MNDQSSKPTILLVDDVPGNIKILANILREDYKILIATSGQKALNAVETHEVDLVILDIVMPEMDGHEVCRRLQANTSTCGIPVIFVTGQNEEMNETAGLALGAVDYVTKPASPAILRARVRTHLKISSLNLSLEQALEAQKNDNILLERANQFVRKTFGRYISDEVVKSILDTPEGLQLGGEKREVTVMMTDLRGFTAIGERLEPEEVITMLNIYLNIMIEIILKYNGTIIEFLGDGILAIFGAPVTRNDDAQQAVACVLEMQLAMPLVNEKNREKGFPEVIMGCGLNTGQVVTGNIGSDQRSKYGVVGNTINLASRIESFTVGGQILISESTKKACNAALRIDDQWLVRAKGIKQPITIYQLGGIADPYNIQLAEPEHINLQQIVDGPRVRLTISELLTSQILR
jgi:adenylate cyclase